MRRDRSGPPRGRSVLQIRSAVLPKHHVDCLLHGLLAIAPCLPAPSFLARALFHACSKRTYAMPCHDPSVSQGLQRGPGRPHPCPRHAVLGVPRLCMTAGFSTATLVQARKVVCREANYHDTASYDGKRFAAAPARKPQELGNDCTVAIRVGGEEHVASHS